VTGFNTTNMPGIQNTDISRAQQILTDLAGSVANIIQAFSLRPDPFNIQWADYPNYYQKYRDFHQNEFSAFFKDDWKIHNRLTLNLGVRWEWYGVPYEASGMMARPVGGTSGAFGLTGRSFDDWYKPGERGQLTTFEFVGKHSPNPSEQLHNDDWNNFGPAIGLSWQLPWLKRNTVLRGLWHRLSRTVWNMSVIWTICADVRLRWTYEANRRLKPFRHTCN
jgi:outer membrane receptor protein involved in Fe transport